MTSEDTRLGGSSGSVDLSSVPTDVTPAADNTQSLGSDTNRWAIVYAVLAVVTSITIGGVLLQSNAPGWVLVNGSMNVSGNVTANSYYGDGSHLTGLAGGGDITEVNTPDKYIYGGATSGAINLRINETNLNNTIQALLVNFTNSSFKTDVIPGNISCNRINGSSSNLCTLVDTDTIGTNLSFNIGYIPGSLNSSKNQTMDNNIAYCFGGSSCPGKISYNGSVLRIRVS